MNSVKKLLQFDFDADAFARRAPKPIPISPERFADLEKIQREHTHMCNIPEREDLRQIYHLFFNAIRTGRLRTEFDSPRRVRQLAWALTYSEDKLPRIVDIPELRDALQLIEDQFRMSQLHGVFNALLQAWDAWGAGLLRVFVRRHLADYGGRQKFFQNLKANLAWYCEESGANRLAMSLSQGQMKLSAVWSCLNLPNHMHGYRYFGIVGKAYVKERFESNHRLEHNTVTDVIEFVKMHRDDKTNRAIVSTVIEKLAIDAPKDLRQPVQSYVLRNWGDPRVAGGTVRWRDVSDKALRILRVGLQKKISVFSLMSSPEHATIRSFPTEGRSGWRISERLILAILIRVVPCCVGMPNHFLLMTFKLDNTTWNGNPLG